MTCVVHRIKSRTFACLKMLASKFEVRFIVRSIVPVFLIVGFPLVSDAASFDCNVAKTEMEKIICADKVLSVLDEELARVYHKVLANTADSAKVRVGQRSWLKNRNDVCSKNVLDNANLQPDRLCLKTAYEYRIWDLTSSQDKYDLSRTQRYHVAWGWDRPMCKALATVLNHLIQRHPPVCQMQVGTFDPDFSLPDWQELDVRKYRDVVKAIWIDGSGSASNMSPSEIVESDRLFNERFEAGSFKLARANFDINSSGNALLVYRAELDSCESATEDFPLVPRLYSVGPNGKIPNSSFRALSSPPRDVFLYKGRAYLAWWSGRSSQKRGSLGVSETVSPRKVDFGAIPVCTISYKG